MVEKENKNIYKYYTHHNYTPMLAFLCGNLNYKPQSINQSTLYRDICYNFPGSAIPEGPTAYVLTREAGGYWIWNASTGEKFRASDNYCPVQSIGCLVGVDNVSCTKTLPKAPVPGDAEGAHALLNLKIKNVFTEKTRV